MNTLLKNTGLLFLAGFICNCVAGCDPTSNQRSLPYRTVKSEVETEVASDDEKLKQLLDKVIKDVYFNRELSTEEHAAWQILHGVLAYGKNFLVRNDEGRLVRVLDHLESGGRMKGWTMRPGKFYGEGKNRRQGVVAVLESGSGTGQGHADQWIAVLSQCGLKKDWKFKLKLYGDREFTIGDLIYQTQQDVYQGKEMSWTIIALMNYLDLEKPWTIDNETTESKEAWNLERILQLETGEEVNESACGGTHRLIGISMCLNKYLKSDKYDGQELTGTWKKALEVIERNVFLAKENRSVDGSFSSLYFIRPSYSSDLGVRLGTTGHILEFLTFALSTEKLKERWVKRAAIHLCEILEQTKNQNLECGKLYHAMHGVVLYRERLYGEMDKEFAQWSEELLEKDRQKAAKVKK